MDINDWKKKHSNKRNLAHFDAKVSLKQAWSFINNPQKVASHGFYPFIHYTLSFRKFDSTKLGNYKIKTRDICYSAHLDRYIYQYYSYKLNQYYNIRLKKDNTADAAIAYRDDLHKNNIHFAKKAIDFIKTQQECYVIIGDFTKFFDNLDHGYLKEMICNLLATDRLPADYYAVFKNITKYSTWNREDLLALNGLKNRRKDIDVFNQLEKAISPEQFKQLKKKYLHPNKNNFGIPQGSAISAVFSNIYMLEFDKAINDYIIKNDGLFMRYSDDFIIVLPAQTLDSFKLKFQYIRSVIQSIPNVKLEAEKTQIFKYSEGIMKSCNEDVLENVSNNKNFMNYLGFTFDGKNVSIRAKTISKYYYRLYRKLKTVVKSGGITTKKKKISCRNIYTKYSIKGSSIEKKHQDGNFITYVIKAERIFMGEKAVSLVRQRHMQKIRRQLNKVKK